jgi:hypothetical protein
MNFCEKTAVSPNLYAGFVRIRKTALFDTPEKTFFVITKTLHFLLRRAGLRPGANARHQTVSSPNKHRASVNVVLFSQLETRN